MNILLITDSFPPEIRSASHLMQELAEELVRKKHRVAVATSFPKYNVGNGFKKRDIKEFSTEDGVDVIRVKVLPHHRVNFIFRGISFLTMTFLFNLKINKHIKSKIDIVIVYSP